MNFEDVLDDGNFIVEKGQQQAIYNDVVKDMAARSSVSGNSMSLQELYARKAMLDNTPAAVPPQDIMSKKLIPTPMMWHLPVAPPSVPAPALCLLCRLSAHLQGHGGLPCCTR